MHLNECHSLEKLPVAFLYLKLAFTFKLVFSAVERKDSADTIVLLLKFKKGALCLTANLCESLSVFPMILLLPLLSQMAIERDYLAVHI